MYCTNCGQEQPDNVKFCTNCGKDLTTNVDVFAPSTSEETKVVPTKISALVCGIISLFIAGFILGIVAIVLSRKEDQKHRTAAMVLGIIGLVGWAIFMIIQFSNVIGQ